MPTCASKVRPSYSESSPRLLTFSFPDILAPLTSVTDLPSHPTLSRPYNTKTLTELAKESCNTMQKENAALWKVKHLLTRLVGDHTWVPCETMLGPNDTELFRNDYIDYNSQAQGSAKLDGNMLVPEDAQTRSSKNVGITAKDQLPANTNENTMMNGERHGSVDTPMVDAEPPAGTSIPVPESVALNGKAVAEKEKHNEEDSGPGNTEEKDAKIAAIDILQSVIASTNNGTKDPHITNIRGSTANSTTAPREADSKATQHNHQSNRDVENGDSRAASVVSEFTDDLPIHPLFLPPRAAHPDRDQGIPEAEAEDMRRLLQLYVQKQEEVCRGAKRLYLGLLRADRLRKTVRQWSKYEAHVGPNRDMSDGEDWYDKEEWGLEDDLKKGQDEEEEDTTQTTKKTRTRR